MLGKNRVRLPFDPIGDNAIASRAAYTALSQECGTLSADTAGLSTALSAFAQREDDCCAKRFNHERIETEPRRSSTGYIEPARTTHDEILHAPWQGCLPSSRKTMIRLSPRSSCVLSSKGCRHPPRTRCHRRATGLGDPQYRRYDSSLSRGAIHW